MEASFVLYVMLQPMREKMKDVIFKCGEAESKGECWVAGWSKIGEWVWLKEGSPVNGQRSFCQVRKLTDAEVKTVCIGYMYWGVKLAGQPWAIVKGLRSAKSSAFTQNRDYDHRFSIGV